MTAKISIKLRIMGKVQGVGFRYFTKRTAEALNISGWTQNLEGGSVQVVAIGTKEDIGRFLDYCKSGPTLSRVEKLIPQSFSEVEQKKLSGMQNFVILRS